MRVPLLAAARDLEAKLEVEERELGAPWEGEPELNGGERATVGAGGKDLKLTKGNDPPGGTPELNPIAFDDTKPSQKPPMWNMQVGLRHSSTRPEQLAQACGDTNRALPAPQVPTQLPNELAEEYLPPQVPAHSDDPGKRMPDALNPGAAKYSPNDMEPRRLPAYGETGPYLEDQKS